MLGVHKMAPTKGMVLLKGIGWSRLSELNVAKELRLGQGRGSAWEMRGKGRDSL